MTSPSPTGPPAFRQPVVAARIGMLLGVCIVICFATGLFSHFLQHPPAWFDAPRSPYWLFQATQGLHVATGVAAIPLLILKIAVVYPKLFERPVFGGPKRIAERLSTGAIVLSMSFQLFTGLLNIAQWYPWKFFFPAAHYATAFVVLGAVGVHLAIKMPIVREAFRRGTEKAYTPGVSRRTVLTAGVAAAGLAVVTIGTQSIPGLHRLAVLAPRSGRGPQGMPVNRTAAAAGVTESARAEEFRLVIQGPRTVELTLAQLQAMPQHTVHLPIACVEGWTQYGWWTGVRIADLAALAGLDDTDLRFASLERGLYAQSTMEATKVRDETSLIALRLSDEELDIDHGYPCRVIAAARPGVHQTKWVTRIEAA